jgi:hypothetical protein
VLKPERQPVYDALDAMPDPIFAALMTSLAGINRLIALAVVDDPTPNDAFAQALQPWLDKLAGK